MTARKKSTSPPVWRKAEDGGSPTGNKLGVRRWLLPGSILILPYGIELGDYLLINTVNPDGTLVIDRGHWPPRYRRI